MSPFTLLILLHFLIFSSNEPRAGRTLKHRHWFPLEGQIKCFIMLIILWILIFAICMMQNLYFACSNCLLLLKTLSVFSNIASVVLSNQLAFSVILCYSFLFSSLLSSWPESLFIWALPSSIAGLLYPAGWLMLAVP
jgi:hypothetical protein